MYSKLIDVQTKSWVRKFGVHKILRSQKIWVKQNFGKKISIKKVKACKELGPKRLVKIGSVTAEIFLIWTNVALTNVAWTNVSVNLFKRVPGTSL